MLNDQRSDNIHPNFTLSVSHFYNPYDLVTKIFFLAFIYLIYCYSILTNLFSHYRILLVSAMFNKVNSWNQTLYKKEKSMGFLPIIMRTGAKPHWLSVMLTIDCKGHNLLLSQSNLFTPLRPAHGSMARASLGLHHH